MGYTHYFGGRSKYLQDWQSIWPELVQDARTIIDAADIELQSDNGHPPIVDEEQGIHINGVEGEDHETLNLLLDIKQVRGFCKTARKPYDIVVCVVLLRAKALAGNAFSLSSDGDWQEDEWQQARHLYGVLWPGEPLVCPWEEEENDSPGQANDEVNRVLFAQQSTFAERQPPTQPPQNHVETIGRWLLGCSSDKPGHESCGIGDGKNWAGMRLIDVATRCIVPAPLTAPFVALSYVWGGVAQACLTQETMSELMRPGGLDDPKFYIPRTIAESIALCERIGEKYLWVDALCIQQDDPRDKLFQIPRMRAVYGTARLNIVSAAGANSNASLWSFVSRAPGSEATPKNVAETLAGSVWETRGWTFQEKLLARRMLIFAEEGLYFHCAASSYSHKGESLPTLANDGSFSGPGSMVNIPPGKQLEAYCKGVEHFSARKLTVQSDVDKAMIGIQRSFGRFMDGEDNVFFDGHPTCAFDQVFCWEVHEHQPLSRREEFKSWSWQGWQQSVFFDPEIYTSRGKDTRTGLMLHQQWSCMSTGCRDSGCERPAVKMDVDWNGQLCNHWDWGDNDEEQQGSPSRKWGFPTCSMPNHPGLPKLYLMVTYSQLSIAEQPSRMQGTNGAYDVFSQHGSRSRIGEILLDKDWRDGLICSVGDPDILFLPVFGVETAPGQWTITKLMCLGLRIPGNYPSGYERIQIMRCSVSEEEWEDTFPRVIKRQTIKRQTPPKRTATSMEPSTSERDSTVNPPSLVAEKFYVGSVENAREQMLLDRLAITHLVNAAEEFDHPWRGQDCYLHVPLFDRTSERVTPFFEQTWAFIGSAHARGANVMVFCQHGISRSVTLALSYKMSSDRLTLAEAFARLRDARHEAEPNPGFLRELRQLEYRLHGRITSTRPLTRFDQGGDESATSGRDSRFHEAVADFVAGGDGRVGEEASQAALEQVLVLARELGPEGVRESLLSLVCETFTGFGGRSARDEGARRFLQRALDAIAEIDASFADSISRRLEQIQDEDEFQTMAEDVPLAPKFLKALRRQ